MKDPRLEFDIVLSDLDMPPGPGGLAVMKAAKQLHPLSHVIIMTGYSGLETALDGIRHGAFDYIAKPFKLIEIEILVDRIQERLKLLDDNKRLSQRLGSMTTHLQTMNSRLERIESAICRIAANVPGCREASE